MALTSSFDDLALVLSSASWSILASCLWEFSYLFVPFQFCVLRWQADGVDVEHDELLAVRHFSLLLHAVVDCAGFVVRFLPGIGQFLELFDVVPLGPLYVVRQPVGASLIDFRPS